MVKISYRTMADLWVTTKNEEIRRIHSRYFSRLAGSITYDGAMFLSSIVVVVRWCGGAGHDLAGGLSVHTSTTRSGKARSRVQ